jgi:predicted ATPase/class 3 adenylate cyclase
LALGFRSVPRDPSSVKRLPSGTVTLLFTDIEGSTRLLHELGGRYAEVLAEHRRVLREAFGRHRGVEVDTQGDSFFYVFARAGDAVGAAAEAQAALADGPVRVRMGVHTGEPLLADGGYVGVDVHRGARIAGSGHGGQVLVSESTRQLVESSVELRDLGLHRLKDLTEAQHLYQLGDGEFPPLRTLNQTNLPVAATPLVGREQEVRELRGLVLDGARLVTVTGAGGCGKTRLALQAAADLVEHFDDGVFWVPLAGIADPDLVLPAAGQVAGVRDELAVELAQRRMLLLLDNFEHVLDAATPLAEVLATAPHVRVLVTSRAPLRIDGEREYALDSLREDEAVALFVERARRTAPAVAADETVAEICRRLDHLPLAIELAAARTKLLPPDALLERTLSAAIDWSYELLDADARAHFERLSVFAGSFSIEAAEEVAEADVGALGRLVDFSLVKATADGRFLMLETIREYAAEALDGDGEAAALRRRHAVYFRGLADRLGADANDAQDFTTLDAEQSNFRAALEWSLASGSIDTALSIVRALGFFWIARGYGWEAYEWCRRIIPASTHVDPAARVEPLATAAMVARIVGDDAWAEQLEDEVIATARATGNELVVAETLSNVSLIAADRIGLERARELAEEALAIRERTGDEVEVARARARVAIVDLLAGRTAQARGALEQTLDKFDLASHANDFIVARAAIGECRRREGDLRGASADLREALELTVRFGETLLFPALLQEVAGLAQARGDALRAATLLGSSERLYDAIHLPIWNENDRNETISSTRSSLGADRYEDARREGLRIETDDALAIARATLG